MVDKKIIGICFGILFLIVLIFCLGFYGFSFNRFSGHAILDLTANYPEGQPIEGALTLSLKEGELIPASSKILFIDSEQVYEYDLTEFIIDDLVEGNFYIEGQVLSGSGLGYGIIGKKIIYPKVDFTLNVYSPKSSGSSNQPEEIIEEEVMQTENIESNVEEEIPEEVEPEIEVLPEEKIIEQSEIEVVQSNEESVKIQEVPSEEEPETVSESETNIEAPITGGIIQNFFKIISNFFLGITPTGQVSLEFETEINGEVSQIEPFTYTLQEGQTVEIVSSSQNIELNVQDNEVIVTTDYSEIEQGFGENYLTDTKKEIVIDLSSLDLMIEGELEVSLIYGEEAIISLITVPEEKILPEVVEVGIDNVLSDLEKEMLFQEFGDSTIKITKAESNGDRIVIRFELGEYWFEPSYDSEEEMYVQIEEDRIRWLQDIANTLLQEEIVSEELIISGEEIKIF